MKDHSLDSIVPERLRIFLLPRRSLSRCVFCEARIFSRDLIAHVVEEHAAAPSHAPRLGNPVWARGAYCRLSVARAKTSYGCDGCGARIVQGTLHASAWRTNYHFCVPKCANFQVGVKLAEERIRREQSHTPTLPPLVA